MSLSSIPSESFPRRLRAARECRRLSQEELARRAGLQASAISHFETRSRRPSFENLWRLAEALNVTTDYLLGRASEMQIRPLAMAWLDQRYAELSAERQQIVADFVVMLAQRNDETVRHETDPKDGRIWV